MSDLISRDSILKHAKSVIAFSDSGNTYDTKAVEVKYIQDATAIADIRDAGNRCFLCGGVCGWSTDFSFEDMGINEDGFVSCWACGNCVAEYEIYQSFEKEE